MDFEPDVLVGPGFIEVRNSQSISFKTYGSPVNLTHSLHALERAFSKSYDTLSQLRLIAEDYDGNEWNSAYFSPTIHQQSEAVWIITGQLKSITTIAQGTEGSSVELFFTPMPDLPLNDLMETVSSIHGQETSRNWRPARQQIEILGCQIEFSAVGGDSLSVSATASEKLNHPYLENWLSEPLRILLGQLVYPRLVARNLGNGYAHISLRAAPSVGSTPKWIGLWGNGIRSQKQGFWHLYSRLLTMLALSRDSNGNPLFESNPVTRFYEEACQASLGSRWVLCMTLASTAEGLVRLLSTESTTQFKESEVQELRTVIQNWHGNEELKSRILSWFARLGETGIGNQLRALKKRGLISQANENAWNRVRGLVMHGQLVSPWSSRKEDEQILQLADLIHRLTEALLELPS